MTEGKRDNSTFLEKWTELSKLQKENKLAWMHILNIVKILRQHPQVRMEVLDELDRWAISGSEGSNSLESQLAMILESLQNLRAQAQSARSTMGTPSSTRPAIPLSGAARFEDGSGTSVKAMLTNQSMSNIGKKNDAK